MQVQAKSTWRASPPVVAREDCTLCQGTGWQLVSSAGLSQARRCSCGILHRMLRVKEHVRIPQRYEHCTLDEYHPSTLSQVRALSEARRFVDRFPRTDRGLFFTGGPGSGKTHLAVGILLELLQRFHDDILFVDFQSLLVCCRPTTQRFQGRSLDLFPLKAASLLVLDDLVSGRATVEADSLLQEILFARTNAGRVTIFTANQPEHDRGLRCGVFAEGSRMRAFLPGIPPQLLMRFLSSVKVLHVSGQDFRRRQSESTPLFLNPLRQSNLPED